MNLLSGRSKNKIDNNTDVDLSRSMLTGSFKDPFKQNPLVLRGHKNSKAAAGLGAVGQIAKLFNLAN